MAELRSRLESIQRRLGGPSRAVVRFFWWECLEHPGHYTLCPIESGWVDDLEGEHVCVPEEALGDVIRLTWGDETDDPDAGKL